VDDIFGVNDFLAGVNAMGEEEKITLRRDMIAIVFLMTAYGYYDGECRKSTNAEDTIAQNIDIDDVAAATILNSEVINRAATFILARMHTKYQTNHVLGGSPMQASMASSVRAFYSIGSSGNMDTSTRARLNAYATCLHWALHPANERLLIPAVINDSKINKAYAHTNGPEVTAMGKEEYFTIRANTPPASTHHFYVAAAAVQHLEPLGILSYLPSIHQMKDIQTGWLLIKAQGAHLHPAARHWGLTRVTANQKIVEPVCADLGYAIKKLMPMSSLAESPILKKEDALNATWKKFIDALRAAMDQHGENLLDTRILDDIKATIMPAKKDDKMVQSIKKLLIQHIGDDDEEDEDEDDDEGDSDDSHPDSGNPPPPAPPGDTDDSDDDNAPSGSNPRTTTAAGPSNASNKGKQPFRGKAKQPTTAKGNVKGKVRGTTSAMAGENQSAS